MKKQALKDLLYSGVMGLVNSQTCYNKSAAGRQFNYFNEEGKQAILDFVEDIAWHIQKIEQKELDEHAKKMVFEGLKKKDF